MKAICGNCSVEVQLAKDFQDSPTGYIPFEGELLDDRLKGWVLVGPEPTGDLSSESVAWDWGGFCPVCRAMIDAEIEDSAGELQWP